MSNDHNMDIESYHRWRDNQDDRIALMYEVLGVVGKLDTTLREIYERHELGQTFHDIGLALKMNECTVRYKYRRARILVKNILKGRQ